MSIFSAEWGTEVDAYVVHTNYEEYALMISVKERSPGQNSISVKLYSVWTLVMQHHLVCLSSVGLLQTSHR